MNTINTLIRMYYIPTHYYWLDQYDVYNKIVDELSIIYNDSKEMFNRNKKISNKLIEKTVEYNQYKSNIIRLIIFKYVHSNPNGTGKELIIDILNKWNDIKTFKQKDKELIYNRTFSNILKSEKVINNMEDIMMLINLSMLENYYE